MSTFERVREVRVDVGQRVAVEPDKGRLHERHLAGRGVVRPYLHERPVHRPHPRQRGGGRWLERLPRGDRGYRWSRSTGGTYWQPHPSTENRFLPIALLA